jgi:hypothetical protein
MNMRQVYEYCCVIVPSDLVLINRWAAQKWITRNCKVVILLKAALPTKFTCIILR